MEQVVELFGRYRLRNIASRELIQALKTLLTQHPEAIRQGLGWLDLAQQRQPMPVTEFIQLRADMDFLLRSLALQSPPSGQERTVTVIDDDASTVIERQWDEDDAATVINAASAASPTDDDNAPTVFAAASGNMATDDDATCIAASAANAATPDTDTDATEATRIAAPPHLQTPAAEAEPTVIAGPRHVAEPTLIASGAAAAVRPASPAGSAPAAITRATTSQVPADATRVAGSRDASPKMPHSQRVPPRTVTVPGPTTATPARSSAPVLAVIGTIAIAIMAVGGFAWWHSRPATELATLPVAPLQDAATTPITQPSSAQLARPPVADARDDATADQQETVTLKLQVIDETQKAVEIRPAPDKTPVSAGPVEALPHDATGLLTVVKKRIDQGRLLPADDPGSATFAIKALIAAAPDSNATGEARKLLSQAHLELARQAREKGDLDAAQTHLNNAFDVRLMK